jgi:hypothetical protein
VKLCIFGPGNSGTGHGANLAGTEQEALTGAILLRKRGIKNYGSRIETIGGVDVAGVPDPLHYGHGAVFHLRVYHQPEHGTRASFEGDLHFAIRMGNAGGVGILSGVFGFLVSDLKAD